MLNRVLSHNLRNKLNVIEGHASLLRDVHDDRPLSSLTEIENAATDLMGLAETTQDVDRALSGSRGDTEIDLPERMEQLISASEDQFPSATFSLSYPEEPCRVAVSGLMTAIEEAVENAVTHNDSDEPAVTVQIERRSESWIDIEIETERTIQADRSQLQQLLENLIRNSLEHGPAANSAGDGLTVSIGDLETGFSVADDGQGIPKGDREAVFESGVSTSKDGTGFGLTIVTEIVDSHS